MAAHHKVTRVCLRCGRSFLGDPFAQRCPECRLLHAEEQAERRKLEWRAKHSAWLEERRLQKRRERGEPT